MKNSSTVDMLKWMDMTAKMLGEESTPEEEKVKEREKARAKLSADLGKTNKDLMNMKLDKLNMLIKKKYYDSGKEIDEADMFQFHLAETSKGWEFQMPLNILFGRRTQAFCAQYWDDFFSQAGIDVSFADNIKEALDKAGNINLVMTIAKDMEDEVDLIPGDGEEDETEEDEDGVSVNDVFDSASSGSDESYVDDEFDVSESKKIYRKRLNEGVDYGQQLLDLCRRNGLIYANDGTYDSWFVCDGESFGSHGERKGTDIINMIYSDFDQDLMGDDEDYDEDYENTAKWYITALPYGINNKNDSSKDWEDNIGEYDDEDEMLKDVLDLVKEYLQNKKAFIRKYL